MHWHWQSSTDSCAGARFSLSLGRRAGARGPDSLVRGRLVLVTLLPKLKLNRVSFWQWITRVSEDKLIRRKKVRLVLLENSAILDFGFLTGCDVGESWLEEEWKEMWNILRIYINATFGVTLRASEWTSLWGLSVEDCQLPQINIPKVWGEKLNSSQ